MQGLVGRVEEPHPGSDDEGLGCHVARGGDAGDDGGGGGRAAPDEDPDVGLSLKTKRDRSYLECLVLEVR